VSSWYGGRRRTVELVSKTAVWHSAGLPAVPLRWVLICDPEEFETQALLCTDLDAQSIGADRLLVRETLADGGYLSRNTSTSRIRDAAALVGGSDPERCSGAAGALLAGYALRRPSEGAEVKHRATGGMLRQASSDLLRCSGAGTQGVVGAGGEFLRVASGDQHGNSLAGVRETANRRGLLCSRMAKVQLRFLPQARGRVGGRALMDSGTNEDKICIIVAGRCALRSPLLAESGDERTLPLSPTNG
jgi:hypothetical protein